MPMTGDEDMTPPVWLLAAVETAVNTWLDMDPEGAAALAELEGRVIGIELRGLDLRFYLLPALGKQAACQVLGRFAGEADAWISGAPLSLLKLGLASGEAARQTLFAGDVEIRGDIELGQRFQRLLQRIDIDWEEHLSRLASDVVAHQLGNLARGALRWAGRAGEGLRRDVSEYLREEARLVPVEEEMEDFLDGVDALRSDVERLEQRIARLRRQSRPERGDGA